MDAKKIWSYARRLLAIIPSIFICALGVALLVWPEWGCDPLTTFEGFPSASMATKVRYARLTG